jgi:hypothetical protein
MHSSHAYQMVVISPSHSPPPPTHLPPSSALSPPSALRYVVTQSRQAVQCQDPRLLAGQIELMLGGWEAGGPLQRTCWGRHLHAALVGVDELLAFGFFCQKARLDLQERS